MCDNKISIIVPIYNVQNYIEKCVNSILASTFKNIEIILVDDGSTDDSYLVCLAQEKKDNRIKVLHQDNVGCTGARRAGLSIATGKYIGFVDPDDWIEKDMYSVMYEKAEGNNVDLVITPYYRDNDKGPYKILKSIDVDSGVYKGDELERIKRTIYLDGKRKINGSLWNKLFRREKLSDIYNSLDNGIYRGEDSVVVILYILQSASIMVIDKPFYHAYDRNGSLTHSSDRAYFGQLNLWYLQMMKYLQKSCYQDIIPEFEKFYLYLLSEGILKHSNCELEYKYPNINKLIGKNIIVYGAGKVGQCYYKQFSKCELVNIISWIDINASRFDNDVIEEPNRIVNYIYDYIVIAIENESIVNDVKNSLISDFAINEDRIIWEKPMEFGSLIKEWIYT